MLRPSLAHQLVNNRDHKLSPSHFDVDHTIVRHRTPSYHLRRGRGMRIYQRTHKSQDCNGSFHQLMVSNNMCVSRSGRRNTLGCTHMFHVG